MIKKYPAQPDDCQRFEGQQFPWQHVHPGPVKNACSCRICGASADKTSSGLFVCQESPGHMADGVVGIWSDLTRPRDSQAKLSAVSINRFAGLRG